MKIEQSSLDVIVLDSHINYIDQIIFRLYLSVFSRKPKLEEVSFQIEVLSTDINTMSDIANNFIESPEFKQIHGEINSEELFVDFLYESVLNREPSKNESNFYRAGGESGIRTEHLTH